MTAQDNRHSAPVTKDRSRGKRHFRLLKLMPVAIALLLGVSTYWDQTTRNDGLPQTLIGRPIPEFALRSLGGRDNGLTSADLYGTVSIVNVWASWCAPCRAEMPLLFELAATGVVPIHGINFRDAPESARAFLAEYGDPFSRSGVDRDGHVSIAWGVFGLPVTLVIDTQGHVAYQHVGPFDRETLEDDILQVVQRLQAEGGS